MIDGYGLLNVVAGLRPHGDCDVSLWVRNLLDEDYIQNLTVQSGNSGLIVGTPSDQLPPAAVVRFALPALRPTSLACHLATSPATGPRKRCASIAVFSFVAVALLAM